MQDILVIFDCDGVLVDSEIIASRVESAELTKIGYPISAEEDARRFAGVTQKNILRMVEEDLGYALPDGFEDMLYKKISAAMTEDLLAINDVQNLLRILPNKCVASNGEIKKIANSLKVTGLDIFFPLEHRFSAEMVLKGKPAPDLFLYAADKMGYNPSSCIVIEDSMSGVHAAKSAGMTVFGFTGGAHIIDENHGESLRLAGAAEIFSKMMDLLNLLQNKIALVQ